MPRMAPTVSALAREAMRVAFEDFEKTVTPADSKQMRSASAIGQVRDAALDIERQLAARGSLRNMRRLAPLLNGLEHYGRVIEVLCNGTPFLNWIWAPISLILRLASEYLEAFEHIMKGYTQIAKALGRFEMLSNAFPKDADFQHTLAIFYADILEFHKHAYKFVTRRGWHLLFNTSWGRFQRRFTHLLHDLEKHGELIDMEANARNITEARVHREEFRQWREQNIEKIEQEERHQATKQYQSVLSWLKIDETEQIAIFESICEEGSKYPGTCSWMSNNSRISSWLSRKPDDRQLWVQGNPGTGKSVMSTQLVNFLQSSKSHVLYHFCSYTYASSTRYDAILRSLVHQLLRSSGELTAYAYQEYVVGKKTPTTPSLEQLLGTLLDSLSEAHRSDYVWIIVDGLEECETAKQTRLVNLLLNLASSKDSSHCSTVCKVLLCSRSLPTRTRRLSKKQILSLSRETEHISKAIKLYASQRLRSLHERLRQLEMSAEEIDNVEQLIAEKAGGMFLYARLVLDYLSTNLFFNGEELIQSIERLPATVTEFYQNILSRILVHLDARSTGRIKSVLGWVAFAKRPLRRLELLSALAFSSGSSDVTSPAPRFLQSCQNGVGIDERVAIQEHALASMACLLSAVKIFCKDYCENARLLRLVKGVHGLHIYATEYWTEYLLANAASTGGIDASSSLVDLSYRLTDALAKSSGSVAIPATSLDDRLKLLQEHPRLQLQITRSLWARSQKRLESEVLCQITIFDDGVSKMLGSYQQAVETLLDQDSCPGASIEELRFFKSQFLTSAYTCRLRSCPRATIGFGSAQLRHEHEIGHAGGFRCSIVGCQYPPFRTSQALKSHVDLYHTTTPTRRSIRKHIRHATHIQEAHSVAAYPE
ncbi:hypothetical protein P280DRAFT_491867 [Massarina eburnea CBS 473.64]|uniref:NACHT domain-containing protein n=1 Tax=Massarina eburnea CBS 473.64 TaxID=1395130 RepID=A0A6A6RSX4_9PLEO|nr:hypothetical protein P280DRAFT_491867 [Massarina eburnea CBS 473.64]